MPAEPLESAHVVHAGRRDVVSHALPLPRSLPTRPVEVATRRRHLFPAAIRTSLGLAALTGAGVTLAILAVGGWDYYTTPLRVRGYHPLHPLLRPSGAIGLALGILGLLLMVVMHLYTLRKKWPRLPWPGRVPAWLEFHIFCGVVGPIFITLHTSFKFNGMVSVAYWSMVIVVLSGFVGRYLYVRIPKSIRGQELSADEIGQRAESLKRELLDAILPAASLLKIEAFEARVLPTSEADTTWPGLLFGEFTVRRRLASLRRELRSAGLRGPTLAETAELIAERALLLRRVAYLRKTKRLFDLWHVFHRPLAVLMFFIVALHVATAIYLGYALGRV